MHRLSLGNINAVGLTTPELIYLPPSSDARA
jgi:hypothetical protein